MRLAGVSLGKEAMNPDLEIMVEVKMPRGGSILRSMVRVEKCVFDEYGLSPLPRERELPWAIAEAQKARNQQRARRQISDALGRQLADKLIELIEQNDPQHGYSPEEWRRLNE